LSTPQHCVAIALKAFAVCLGMFCCGSLCAASPKLIPDPETHRSFLLNEYRPGAPSVILFKDPYCGYCINALAKRSRLDNYNVYLFWSPILGRRSVSKVESFFSCDSPVESAILESVVRRSTHDCDGEFHAEIKKLNDEMVAVYSPDSVPQTWFGGQRINISQLTLLKSIVSAQEVAAAANVKLLWNRYEKFAIGEVLDTRLNMAVIARKGQVLSEFGRSILAQSGSYNWYVFDGSDEDVNKSQEFMLLLAAPAGKQPVFVLGGNILSSREEQYLVADNIRALF